MKTAYKRLNRDHRIEIEKLIALGKNNIQIASALSVHPSTISRELKRVEKGLYNNLKAEVNFVHNLLDRRLGKTKIESNPKLKNFVYSHLKLHWSFINSNRVFNSGSFIHTSTYISSIISLLTEL